jgi:transcriptional regulator with XRE-family HTH domain
MTPYTVKAIRKEAGLTQSGLAALLRISDVRTIRRWESGVVPVSGPASILLEMLHNRELPKSYFAKQSAALCAQERRYAVGDRFQDGDEWFEITGVFGAGASLKSIPPPIDTRGDSDGDDGA